MTVRTRRRIAFLVGAIYIAILIFYQFTRRGTIQTVYEEFFSDNPIESISYDSADSTSLISSAGDEHFADWLDYILTLKIRPAFWPCSSPAIGRMYLRGANGSLVIEILDEETICISLSTPLLAYLSKDYLYNLSEPIAMDYIADLFVISE